MALFTSIGLLAGKITVPDSDNAPLFYIRYSQKICLQ
jgi:hypothetical protein